MGACGSEGWLKRKMVAATSDCGIAAGSSTMRKERDSGGWRLRGYRGRREQQWGDVGESDLSGRGGIDSSGK
ncbi:hypothetical protein BHM03_00005271 [Ensete ventricosum]|nr:hypothetical protein BHM03_00005271 [Ensete ventricosum]